MSNNQNLNEQYQNFRSGSVLENLCLWSAATNKSIIAKSPEDRIKYVALGAAMLMIAALAGVSAAIFLKISFKVPFLIALPGGIFWSLLILSLDRLLLSTMQKGKINFLGVALRVVLSVSISFLISEPIMMEMFSGEIDAKLGKDTRETVKKTGDAKRAELSPQIDQLKDENKKLSEHIEILRNSADAAEKAYIGEAEGTVGTKKRGKGIVYKEKLDAFLRAKAAYDSGKTENEAKIRENDSKIVGLENQIAEVEKEVNEDEKAASGALARHKAMYAIVFSDAGAALIYIPLFLAFLCLDTLAISSKLLMEESSYDIFSQAERDKQYKAAENEVTAFETSSTKVNQAQDAVMDRIFEAIKENRIDKLVSSDEKILAEKICREIVSSLENRFLSFKAPVSDEPSNEPLKVVVANHPDIETELHISESSEKSLKLAEFFKSLDSLRKKIESKINSPIVFYGAKTSSGEKIKEHESLLAQLGDDRKVILNYSAFNHSGNNGSSNKQKYDAEAE